MALNSFIGSKLSVSASTPSAITEAGFEALTYTAVGQLMMLPEFGDQTNMIEVPQLSLGRVQRIVGMADGGSATITIAYDASDAGQNILRTGAGTNTVHSFKIEDGHAATNTSEWYLTAIIASLRYAARDGTSAYAFNLEIYPQSDITGPFSSA